MAFEAGSIIARMKLDSSQFKAGLQSGLRDAKKFDSSMGAIFRGGLFATGIITATRQLYNFANTAARLDSMTEAFERMGGGAKKANLILDQSRMVTRALNERELKQAANQLELLGIGMEKLPRFVEIARSAAIGLNQDVGFMLQSLSTGTARQSRLWLDNLGIIIDVDKAHRDYARTLGKATKDLTDNEERAAFLFAVLDQGQVIIDKVGASTETSSEKVQSLGSFARDTVDAFSQNLLPAFTKYVDLMQRLKDMGFPTGPSGLPDAVATLASKIDAIWDGLHKMFPGIFAGSGKGERGAGLSPESDLGFPTMKSGPRASMELMDAMFKKYIRGLGPNPGPDTHMRYRTNRAGMGSLMRPELDSRDILDPGLVQDAAGSYGKLNAELSLADSLFGSIGNSVESLFEALATGANAGKAFAAAMMQGLSGLASSLGDLFIQTGLGTLAIMVTNPFAQIAAGMALKALAGIMRGGAYNMAPHTTSTGGRSVRAPIEDDMAQGGTTFIIQGDFVGNRAWIDHLAQQLRLAGRNRGVKVVWEGAR